MDLIGFSQKGDNDTLIVDKLEKSDFDLIGVKEFITTIIFYFGVLNTGHVNISPIHSITKCPTWDNINTDKLMDDFIEKLEKVYWIEYSSITSEDEFSHMIVRSREYYFLVTFLKNDKDGENINKINLKVSRSIYDLVKFGLNNHQKKLILSKDMPLCVADLEQKYNGNKYNELCDDSDDSDFFSFSDDELYDLPESHLSHESLLDYFMKSISNLMKFDIFDDVRDIDSSETMSSHGLEVYLESEEIDAMEISQISQSSQPLNDTFTNGIKSMSHCIIL
jgi:hypothetical protein